MYKKYFAQCIKRSSSTVLNGYLMVNPCKKEDMPQFNPLTRGTGQIARAKLEGL